VDGGLQTPLPPGRPGMTAERLEQINRKLRQL
jgi:hypothetical protein